MNELGVRKVFIEDYSHHVPHHDHDLQMMGTLGRVDLNLRVRTLLDGEFHSEIFVDFTA